MSDLRYIVVGTDTASVRESAPLQHVSVSGFLRDTVAEYTLVQTYVNPLKDATIEAAYTFPLYEGVAVSGFEAEVDGRKIVGKVQEKAAARKEYEEAVQEGKVASLLEQERPDVFQASIGNIPPAKTISIRITLISAIKQDADENQVRFVLPTTVAPRYGIGPDVSSTSSSSKLSVEISCAMAKQITSIESPSHTIQVHLGSSPTRVSLTADALLHRDLVIIVRALGLDSPRAFVEHHPTDGTHAVSLTFSPRFALNPLKSSELIFLVDRSGSMQSGSQIEQAGEALELFLRSIPSEDCYINIIGFGSTHEALFPKSVEYSAESLKASTKYAQALMADMGGTEMMSAFQEAFQRRRQDVPTQIFVLTDGEIWDVDALVQCIKEAVDEGEKRNSFVRVFSLGVGAAVSHHLIESVARAGGGYAQLVVEGERMEKKVVNMLKAALMPPVTDVGIQWTDAVEDVSGEEDFEMVEAVGEDSQPVVDPKDTVKEVISLFSTTDEVPSPPPPPPSVLPDVVIQIQQAPFKVPALYRGARFTIFAILSPETPVPKELILRGSSPDGPVELKVNVESVQEGETMLHALAARTLVRDLEEGASCIHALGGNPTNTSEQMLKKLGVHVAKEGKKCKNRLSEKVVSELAKRKILELALKYNLSTKYTSWVAIDTERDHRIIHDKVAIEAPAGFGLARGWAGFGLARGLALGGLALGGGWGVPPGNPARRAASAVPIIQPMRLHLAVRAGNAPGPSCTLKRRSMKLAVAAESATSSSTESAVAEDLDAEFGSSHLGTPAEQQSLQPRPLLGASLPGMTFSGPTVVEEREELASTDPHARLHSLLQHQQFNGLFPLVPEIAALFSTTVKELQAKLGEVRKEPELQLSEPDWETLWATCLAVEFLRKQLPDLQEEWELVVEKAEKRVAAMAKSAAGVAALQRAASEVMKTDKA